jgi:hypothetical protein
LPFAFCLLLLFIDHQARSAPPRAVPHSVHSGGARRTAKRERVGERLFGAHAKTILASERKINDESFRAYPHAPTRTSNSPHRRCHRTGISIACPVGWEWARVGMGVGTGVHVCAGGRGCWPWRGRGACERAPWACGARPSPCHTGRARTHALPTTRPSAPPRRPRHTVRPPRHWLTPTLNSD